MDHRLCCETQNYKTFRRKSSGSTARQQVLRLDTQSVIHIRQINSTSSELNFHFAKDPVKNMKVQRKRKYL